MSTAAPLPDHSQPETSGGVAQPQAQRRGRALIGWMKPEDAARALVGGQMDAPIDLDLARRAQAAREAVAARSEAVNQDGLIDDPPAGLAEHTARLQQDPRTAPLFAEGWELKIVDLSRVIAFQPYVIAEHAEERVAAVAPDVASIASITVPIPTVDPLPGSFDQTKACWVFSSANPNLQVCGHFGGPLQPGGPTGFGFIVAALPSLMQVARYQGRYFLRDGYHRAYGLLRRGIANVPALVREIDAIDQLGVKPGMLPQEAFLGDKPPLLRDYLDDDLAADVSIPATHKVIAVQAIELTTLG